MITKNFLSPPNHQVQLFFCSSLKNYLKFLDFFLCFTHGERRSSVTVCPARSSELLVSAYFNQYAIVYTPTLSRFYIRFRSYIHRPYMTCYQPNAYTRLPININFGTTKREVSHAIPAPQAKIQQINTLSLVEFFRVCKIIYLSKQKYDSDD